MKIMVLSDTHIPRVAHDLPAEIYNEIPNVDMILHAGDFVDREVYDKLSTLKKTCAVYGNMDAPDLRRLLKEKEIVQVGKFKIGLIHGYGAPRDLMNTIRNEFSGVHAIVFGHSHVPVNTVKDGILFFNPGSPTDVIFATSNSYGILDISDQKIEGRIVTLKL